MFKNNLDIHFKEGIYELNIKNSITQKVGKFYAENPFPDYKIDDYCPYCVDNSKKEFEDIN